MVVECIEGQEGWIGSDASDGCCVRCGRGLGGAVLGATRLVFGGGSLAGARGGASSSVSLLIMLQGPP